MAAPTYVNVATRSTTGSSNVRISDGSGALATTAGNTLVAFIAHEGTSTTLNVSNTGSDTWTAAETRSHTNGDMHTKLWYAEDITGNAADDVVVNFAAGRTYQVLIVIEVGPGVFDASTQNEGANGVDNNLTTGNFDTTGDAIVAGFYHKYSSGAFTAGASYTERADLGTAAAQTREYTGAQTVAAACTQATTQAWLALGLAIKAAGGGASAPKRSLLLGIG